VIKKTDLPTLDIIPETGELAELERRLQGADGREAVFKKKRDPVLSKVTTWLDFRQTAQAGINS